jgi:Family of unknown function (DUF6111)
MLRIALIDILLFALPFLVYAVYMVAVKGAASGSVWQTAPILWLAAAGFGLLIITMVTLVQFSGSDKSGTYHPSVIENGTIKPGDID